MKPSSIEWLEDKALKGFISPEDFERAKKMHKQESEYDYVAGGNYARCCSTIPKDIKKSHEQYYNETYNIKR